MNDFSVVKIFRLALNALLENFTDIFLVTVLSASSVLVAGLFLNTVFLSRVNEIVGFAVAANAQPSSAYSNPFILYSFCTGVAAVFAAFAVFCLFSLFLPLCKNKEMKLRNFIPSLKALSLFSVPALILFAFFETAALLLPAAVRSVSAGLGLSVFSALSFAAVFFLAVSALKYFFFFPAVLENAGLAQALKKSGDITAGHRLKLFVFFVLLFLVNYFAKYFVFLLLLTVPFSVLSVIYVYLELSGLDFNPDLTVRV